MITLYNIHNSSTPISKNDLDKLEEKIGYTLPDEVKLFYLKNNGGKPNPYCVHDNKRLYTVNAFLSIEEILHDLDWTEEDYIPNELDIKFVLPLAYDDFGNEFILYLDPDNYGKVYFYVPEDDMKIYGVWDSFNDFLNNFVEDPDDESDDE